MRHLNTANETALETMKAMIYLVDKTVDVAVISVGTARNEMTKDKINGN